VSAGRTTLEKVVSMLCLLLLVGAVGCGGEDSEDGTPPPTSVPAERPPRGPGEARPVRNEGGPRIETLARGLEIPWEIAFLPDRRALITERPGNVRLLSRNGRLLPSPIAQVEVSALGEGGLLGVAIDPDFERNHFVYLYLTSSSGNEVARYRLQGERLRREGTIVDGIQAGPIHDGGRIHFGPDQRLYLSTGDAGDPGRAQDAGSLNGKFLRLDREQYRGGGGQPEIFSSGHRNPQGFDWQPRTNRLISTEHGPEGNDEVNLVREGRNYGWPQAQGADHGGFAAPLTVYEQTIAPSGATFVSLPDSEWTGDYLIGALAGEQIRRLSFDGTRVTRNEQLFEGEFGRVRTVVEGPDGALYALTSNRDGRGTPREGDDRVLRIVPPAG
jgi:glucose/arabinose dehydrogenase